MNHNIEKYYLIYDTCMKLKERGFDVWCDKFYGPYPHYKGEAIGSDEEYELRSEGKGKSIRNKIIIQHWTHHNSMHYNKKSCSCPDINMVVDWMLENWNTNLSVKPYYENDKIYWLCDIHYISEDKIQYMHTITSCEHKYKAYADAIRWVLDNYKVI